MSKLLYGSIDFSKLLENAKQGHPAFKRVESGKIYLNLNVWINDEPDQFGNNASMQATFKDAPKEAKFYFGNLKLSTPKEPTELGQGAADIPDDDGLPF